MDMIMKLNCVAAIQKLFIILRLPNPLQKVQVSTIDNMVSMVAKAISPTKPALVVSSPIRMVSSTQPPSKISGKQSQWDFSKWLSAINLHEWKGTLTRFLAVNLSYLTISGGRDAEMKHFRDLKREELFLLSYGRPDK